MTETPDIYRRATNIWGHQAQIDMALEEMGELIVALQQHRRGRVTSAAVQEEIADVQIMMRQMATIFGEDEVILEERRKLQRLQMRVQSAEERRAQT